MSVTKPVKNFPRAFFLTLKRKIWRSFDCDLKSVIVHLDVRNELILFAICHFFCLIGSVMFRVSSWCPLGSSCQVPTAPVQVVSASGISKESARRRWLYQLMSKSLTSLGQALISRSRKGATTAPPSAVDWLAKWFLCPLSLGTSYFSVCGDPLGLIVICLEEGGVIFLGTDWGWHFFPLLLPPFSLLNLEIDLQR